MLQGECRITGVVVLAAMVFWLQTKLGIRIQRKGGTMFTFHARKASADAQTLDNLANTTTEVLFGNNPPAP